eukprot:CAMPEP_0202879766 /NCGR_PEP_ID=MMETSP1391-20130828/34067_1 /ASSEMBLY_ACC=CAM_ASM_000867 /TAXON_ID=1034604 /ORGANISM="Chlamydomonas leiostraca, Strain SAG 11-49" /LENGTH=103 /DNA_ID=CAMNT_0049562167 /DNA_START=135 /DNA_END=443 /DNA_ORIENTATION=+
MAQDKGAGPAAEHLMPAECLVKCAQCVLSSRIFDPAPRTGPPDKRRSRWFLLELEEIESARPVLDACKRNVCSPLTIEVHLEAQGDAALQQQLDQVAIEAGQA